MRIFSWNINGLGPTIRNITLKHSSVKGFFEHHDADVVCLQEVKLPDNKLTQEAVCVPGFESFWAISKEKQGYSGVTTYVQQEYSPLSAQVDCLGGGFDEIDREGRVVLTDLGDFVLVNVYVPNAGDRPERARLGFKLRFLRALKDKLDALTGSGRQVVVVGDLNIAAERRDVHSSFNYDTMYSSEELAVLHELLASYPDTWRWLHPDTQDCYTVWDEKTSARAFNAGLRLDYVLCSPALLPRITSCEIVDTPPKWSDHAALLLEIRDVPVVAPHPPCTLSSLRMKRFNDTSQPSIAALFGKKRPAAQTEPTDAAPAKRAAVAATEPGTTAAAAATNAGSSGAVAATGPGTSAAAVATQAGSSGAVVAVGPGSSATAGATEPGSCAPAAAMQTPPEPGGFNGDALGRSNAAPGLVSTDVDVSGPASDGGSPRQATGSPAAGAVADGAGGLPAASSLGAATILQPERVAGGVPAANDALRDTALHPAGAHAAGSGLVSTPHPAAPETVPALQAAAPCTTSPEQPGMGMCGQAGQPGGGMDAGLQDEAGEAGPQGAGGADLHVQEMGRKGGQQAQTQTPQTLQRVPPATASAAGKTSRKTPPPRQAAGGGTMAQAGAKHPVDKRQKSIQMFFSKDKQSK